MPPPPLSCLEGNRLIRRGNSHPQIHDGSDRGGLAKSEAEDRRDQVEVGCAYQAPVETANYQEHRCNAGPWS